MLRAITQFGAIFQAPGADQFHRVRLHAARGRPAQRGHRRIADRLRPRRPRLARHQDRDLAEADLQLRDQSDHGHHRHRGRRHRRPAPRSAEAARDRRVPRGGAYRRGSSSTIDFLPTITDVFGASRTIASMRQDLMRGRPTEIDHMNGAVVDARAPGRHRLPGERGADGHHQGDGSLYDDAMTRVGIVAKSHLREATPHLVDIESWLAARGHDAGVRDGDRGADAAGGRPRVADKPALVAGVDLLVVLGGDGTLLSVADCVGAAGRRRADSRRQLRQPRLPDRGDAARALPVARGGARAARRASRRA